MKGPMDLGNAESFEIGRVGGIDLHLTGEIAPRASCDEYGGFLDQ